MQLPGASERELFDACLELLPVDREGFLEENCSDPERRERVMRLLRAHDEAGSPLDTPLDVPAESERTRIGPYEIIRPIGEGGMGMVYEAFQTEPVRRRVALKIIRLGLDSKQVSARFEAERQALAVMDHPYIARVLDAGEDATGRPYFVMELVEGRPLSQFCDEKRLTLRQRLVLFTLICQAVQHAHQKGVVHRDLKPSNILVASDGSACLPRVIDFGIAKALGPALLDTTALTMHGQTLGTPAYMSPEQAGLDGLDVDTRADIYSLGVILHQLLSGVLPEDPAELGLPRFLAALTNTRHPFSYASARFGALDWDQRNRIAEHRGTTAPALERDLKGDLEWIVHKAIEKERAHRYATASALAEDVERYLNQRPVHARPPSAGYRLRKFIVRNAAGVAAAALALLAILAGSAGVTAAMLRAQKAEQAALREAEAARRVTAFLTGLFETADPNESRGAAITAKELLDRSAARVSSELRQDPFVEARLSQSLSKVNASLGLYERSLELARRAVELAERSGDRALLASSLLALGQAQQRSAAYQDALSSITRALEIRERLHGPGHIDVAEAAVSLGAVHWLLANSAEALRFHERALAIYEAHYGPDHPDIGHALRAISMDHEQAGRHKEALDAALRALKVLEFTLGADHTAVADALDGAGILYRDLKQPDAARPLHERSLAIRLKLLGPDHPVLAYSYLNLGRLAAEEKNLDAAQGYYEKGLALRERALGANHPRTADVAESYAILEARRGRLADSQRLFERSLTSYLAAYGPTHPETLESRRNLAILLTMRGSHGKAIAQLTEAALNGYKDDLHLEESVFTPLRKHPDWPALESLAKADKGPERP